MNSRTTGVTVNLAPADLPIALGILAASGQIDLHRLAGFEFAGELSLAGDLRPVRGAVAMGLALLRRGVTRALVLPRGNAEEAALVDGPAIRAARHLLEVVRALLPGETAIALPRAVAVASPTIDSQPDLRDVKVQSGAKSALEIAATGGHRVLMVGPPGTGKSMLA